jgi:hypothetical protein
MRVYITNEFSTGITLVTWYKGQYSVYLECFVRVSRLVEKPCLSMPIKKDRYGISCA